MFTSYAFIYIYCYRSIGLGLIVYEKIVFDLNFNRKESRKTKLFLSVPCFFAVL